ncbi:MAG: efflux RND transporter periplasmic adaptor subunit [Bacteroidaceae bacterium]|nr:efflux RND transporter periplasmic adaptor subunit [Bacteroidaceae bacterium]
MKSKKSKIIVAIVLVVAAILIIRNCGGESGKLTVNFQHSKVEKRDINSGVTATGTIEPVTKVEVGTQVSGIISHIYVDYNSIVRKGDIIAELDRTNLISELSSAENNMRSAEAEYNYQKKNLERMKILFEKGLISRDEYETADLSFQKANNSFQTSKFSVNKARTNLGYATITSPIDGVVLSKAIEEGQTVAASYNTPTLFTIAANLADMRLIADIDEADIGSVKEGQRCTYTVDAFPDDIFEGYVTQVRQEPTTTSNVVTYEVVISADNPHLKLKPGLTANVTIYTMECRDVLAVSSKALRFVPNPTLLGDEYIIKDADAENKLWTIDGTTLTAHAVTTGMSNGALTEITGGIENGTQIISDVDFSNRAAAKSTERSPFAPGPPPSKKNK